MTVKRITAKEFREEGYLQELNRRFLHPLGLALEVVVEDDGTERFGEVWDCREDPKGIIYSEDTVDPQKAKALDNTINARYSERASRLGYWIQPIEDKEWWR